MKAGRRPAIVWFTNDLRLGDHAALTAACASGRPVIACYVANTDLGAAAPGAASRWWLHHSLGRLARRFARHGGRLVLRRGPMAETLRGIASSCNAAEIHASRSFEPSLAATQAALRVELGHDDIRLELHPGALLVEPTGLRTQAGRPYRVFTPFWRACTQEYSPQVPLPPPAKMVFSEASLESESLEAWNLLPRKPNWALGFAEQWDPGEQGAHRRLGVFLADDLAAYATARDRPDQDSTSRLSPHLHFGEISPRQVWHAVRTESQARALPLRSTETFLKEIGWREFSHHLLWHWPGIHEAPFRPEFSGFPWRDDDAALRAWQRGQTGFPFVDAGMRQLWATGWMHNRVRMVVASFLVKDLLIHWARGAAWFWDTLVDADLANNSASWQWVAGSGADAAPYFRVFNPASQGRKFDPHGVYVRRWVPELARLPAPYIHDPSAAPAEELRKARVVLGETYPWPIVEHKRARERALAAYSVVKNRSA
jgi:deoxyribodipyrimidine photo-lyase